LTKEEQLVYFNTFKDDLYEFARFFFPHLLGKPSAPFHKEIYKELGAQNKYLAVEVFRGGGKSTIGLIIKPIHFAIFKPIGDITLISKSESFVLNEINRKIKSEFETNERLRAFFGDMVTPKWSETYFVLKNGIAFEGLGIGGQLRGGRRGLIVLDDLEDEETAISEEQRDKLKRRIGKEIAPKLLPEGELVYFGTPVHQLCYLHQVIQTPNNGWKKCIFPAYVNGVQEVGHEAWADMFPHSRLVEFKTTWGSNYFSSEYLCNPIVGENCPIKEDQIRFWTELPKQYSSVIAIDPAYSDDTSSDYKVASHVAIDQGGNRYLLSYIRTHDSIGEFQDQIINMFLSNRLSITGVGVPNSGVEKAFFDSFMRKCEERKVSPPVMELKNAFQRSGSSSTIRNKTARVVASLQPLFQQGKYYISPQHMEAREELLTIGSSKNDDIVDTLAYAEQILQPVYFSMQEYQESVEDLESADRGATGYGV
jgi:hypothetical protein